MVKPKLGVMRFERSIWMSVSCEPSGAGGLRLTCGKEISSATNGSSVRIVAGKNRSPAKPCAHASIVGRSINTAVAAAASLIGPIELVAVIEESQSLRERATGRAAPTKAPRHTADR